MERGIVRARVGLSYDPLRFSPCSLDLYEKKRLQLLLHDVGKLNEETIVTPPPLTTQQPNTQQPNK